MGSFKDRVFSEIRNDYRINRERSFLYGYILENELPEEDKNCGDAEAIDTKVRKLALERLYDIGYPIKERESKRKGKNTALSILDAYVTETGISRDDSELTYYQELYEQLNDMRNTTALIPVRVDVKTGIGFYIIGKDNYKHFPDRYTRAGKTCGIGFLSNWLGGDPGYDNILLTLETDDLRDPPNIDEANRTFSQYVLLDDYRYRSYRDFNGSWPKGKKLSKKFRPFFEQRKDLYSLDEVTDEDIQNMKKTGEI